MPCSVRSPNLKAAKAKPCEREARSRTLPDARPRRGRSMPQTSTSLGRSVRALPLPSLQSSSIPTSAEESHQLNSGASSATILNEVVAVRVRRAFLNLHCLFASKAAQEINQRAFVIVQRKAFNHFLQPYLNKKRDRATSPSVRSRSGGQRLNFVQKVTSSRLQGFPSPEWHVPNRHRLPPCRSPAY
jgi:hypothetical protein